MKIRNLHQKFLMQSSQSQYLPEMLIWACDCKLTNSKEGMMLHHKPELGFLMCGKDEKHHELYKNNGRIGFFVPIGKNGKPVWSRAVNIAARCYADTEAECIELYNELVDESIASMNAIVEKLKALKI